VLTTEAETAPSACVLMAAATSFSVDAPASSVTD
jgi:hypothetical protein